MSRPSVYAAAVFLLAGVMAGARPSSPAVLAQPAPTTDPFSQSGGAMNCAEAVGDIVWLCSGPRLLAVDVSDPAQPRVLGRSAVLPGVLEALALDEGASQAWVLAGDQVLGLDLRDPARPTELGRVYRGESWARHQSLVVTDHRLWMHGTVTGTVLGVDIADAGRPKIVTSLDVRSATGGAVADLAAKDGLLYVLARVGTTVQPVGGANRPRMEIQVFDLRVAGQPARLHSAELTSKQVRDDGDLVWDGDQLWARLPEGRLSAWRSDSRVLTLAVEGKLAGCYLPVGFTIREGRAYASCTTGFADNLAVMVFDLAEGPEFPPLAAGGASVDDPGLFTLAVALAHRTLWVSDRAGRLRGFDVGPVGATPSLLTVGQVTLVGELQSVTWDLARQRLLAVASDALMPLDLADPDRPLVGPVLAGGFHIGQLDADGDRLAMEYRGDGDMISPGIQARDLRDPARAPLVFERNYPDLRLAWGPRSSLGLDGSSLLLAETIDAGTRLSHWEWLPGGQPQRRASWPVDRALAAIDVGGGRAAMVTMDDSGTEIGALMLSVIDLATRAVRDLTVSIPSSGHLFADVRIQGGTLWLAMARSRVVSGPGTLAILRVDLSDPGSLHAEPAWETLFPVGDAQSVQLLTDRSGALLFLAEWPGHVHVLASQPPGLQRIAEIAPPFPIWDMSVAPEGDRVFLASGSGGLISYARPPAGWGALPTPLPPTVTPTATTSPTASATPSATATMVVRSRSWLPWIARHP